MWRVEGNTTSRLQKMTITAVAPMLHGIAVCRTAVDNSTQNSFHLINVITDGLLLGSGFIMDDPHAINGNNDVHEFVNCMISDRSALQVATGINFSHAQSTNHTLSHVRTYGMRAGFSSTGGTGYNARNCSGTLNAVDIEPGGGSDPIVHSGFYAEYSRRMVANHANTAASGRLVIDGARWSAQNQHPDHRWIDLENMSLTLTNSSHMVGYDAPSRIRVRKTASYAIVHYKVDGLICSANDSQAFEGLVPDAKRVTVSNGLGNVDLY
jgi:hypothetical protein